MTAGTLSRRWFYYDIVRHCYETSSRAGHMTLKPEWVVCWERLHRALGWTAELQLAATAGRAARSIGVTRRPGSGLKGSPESIRSCDWRAGNKATLVSQAAISGKPAPPWAKSRSPRRFPQQATMRTRWLSDAQSTPTNQHFSSFMPVLPFQFRTAAISAIPCTGAQGAVFLLDLSSRQPAGALVPPRCSPKRSGHRGRWVAPGESARSVRLTNARFWTALGMVQGHSILAIAGSFTPHRGLECRENFR